MNVLRVITYIGCIFFALIIHELGHLTVALIAGCKFKVLAIGLVHIESQNGKIVFSIEKNVSNWGGMCYASPSEKQMTNYKLLRNILMSGPLASLLVGSIAILFHRLIENYNLLLAKDIFTFGIANIGIGIAGLIPSFSKIESSDIGRVFRLMKHGTSRDVEMAIWRITVRTIENDYNKIDLHDTDILKSDCNKDYAYLGYYYTYKYYKEKCDLCHMNKEIENIRLIEKKVSKGTLRNFPIC